MAADSRLRAFQQAKWDEPLVADLHQAGSTGVRLPRVGAKVQETVGNALDLVPRALRRTVPPNLPALAQPQALSHFLRLSQETRGSDISTNIGLGTSTMKYSPKVHEEFVRSAALAELHPLQPESTLQGLLAIASRLSAMLGQISGLGQFTFQPGGGAQGIYTNARIIRAYHDSRPDASDRDEIITTVFSHPANAACAAVAGFKVTTLYPGSRGYPELDALKAAVSERTAGLMITLPEDTGIFNPEIHRFVDVVHEAGGLCACDLANFNGLLGVIRPGDLGFDLCQFNLHKTFGSPHGAIGLACGAAGTTDELAVFLPVPVVGFDGTQYFLDYDRPASVGKIRSFYGVMSAVVRAYAWIMSLGSEGLRMVAETAVLNSNYLALRLAHIAGLEISYSQTNAAPRLEQIRYSWARLASESGVDTDAISRRTTDFGVAGYFPSHHPWLVPEPCTLEPTEAVSRAELEEYARILAAVAAEAILTPQLVTDSPHASALHRIDEHDLDDPVRWAITWRSRWRQHPVDEQPDAVGRVLEGSEQRAPHDRSEGQRP